MPLLGGFELTATPGSDAHSGRFETSVMLALAPDNVRLVAGLDQTLDELLTGRV
jgi:creatinine amidohydrolase/Fe(II)-dependent formamide hydrolase-like protein